MSKYEVKWYDKGQVGEYLLDQVESLLDGMITEQQFIDKCKLAGLNDQEVYEILNEDVKYA